MNVSGEFVQRFQRELEVRKTIVQRLNTFSVCPSLDWQKIDGRLQQQIDYIQAVRSQPERTIAAPEASIHDTWIEVWQIPQKLLEVSDTEVKVLKKYFAAVLTMVECHKAAKHVTPEVWKGIESRLFSLPDNSL